MPILTLNDIHLNFGAEVIFEKLNMQIYPTDKVGLVGPNGCGKTTMLKIILGQLDSDLGQINKRNSLKIGYLPQEPIFRDDKTILEQLHNSAEELLAMQKQIHQAAEKISQLKGPQQKEVMKQYDRLNHEFELAGGYEFETRVKAITAGLGINEEHYGLKPSQLSGGQLSRLGLAKVLLSNANLLLLDEPTNHLDWNATIWLEKFLRTFPHAVLIVSHDRFLLDRVVKKIIDIDHRRSKTYTGNYSNYRKQKELQKLELTRQQKQRSEFVEKTRDFIERNRNLKGMQKVARGRAKHLEKLLKENPDYLAKQKYHRNLTFDFAEIEDKGQRTDIIINCRKITKKFDGLTLFEDLRLELYTGQKLAIIGPNGSGKTTLLKIILDKEPPTTGDVKIKKNMTIGYLDQSGLELNDENDVIDEARSVASDMSIEKARSALGRFLFSKNDVFKKVADLSGGERNRLALCKLVLTKPEILLLDEPTNHLDIPSIEALENALANYIGTVIVVSHDRFFIDRVADKLLVIGADRTGKKAIGQHEIINGSFSRYREILENRDSQKQSKSASIKTKPKRPKKDSVKGPAPIELKKFNTWPAKKIESAIEETEMKIESKKEKFTLEEVYTDHKKLLKLQAEVDKLSKYLDVLYRAYEWKLQ